MDMGIEFIQGIIEMVESRLGRFGRWITTAVIILIVGAIAATCIDIIVQKLVKPLWAVLVQLAVGFTSDLAGQVLIILIFLVVYGLILTVLLVFLVYRVLVVLDFVEKTPNKQ